MDNKYILYLDMQQYYYNRKACSHCSWCNAALPINDNTVDGTVYNLHGIIIASCRKCDQKYTSTQRESEAKLLLLQQERRWEEHKEQLMRDAFDNGCKYM